MNMPLWLITDTHLHHAAMIHKFDIRPNGFNDKVITNLSMVADDSLFVHLGDVVVGQGEATGHKRILDAVAGARTKVLVRGNHDKKSNTWYYDHGWDLVLESFVMYLWGYTVLFTHEPANPRLGRVFSCNIHGHTHGNGRHAADVQDFYNDKWHMEFAIENTNYEPLLLTEKILRRGFIH